MATAGTYLDIFEHGLGQAQTTAVHVAQALRADESILRRGKRGFGALSLTAAEASNWLIALAAPIAPTAKAPSPIETVRSVRAASRLPASGRHDVMDGLSVADASTFGEALDSLLRDMRSGTFRAWQGRGGMTLNIRFVDGGRLAIVYAARWFTGSQPHSESAEIVFRNESCAGANRAYAFTRINQISHEVLEKIAEALGPLPS